MPSPIGHALGGVAAGWLIGRRDRPETPRSRHAVTALFALLGALPDVDLLAGGHRGATHSLAAALLVGSTVWLVARPRQGARRVAAACAAAYASHVLLDWLGSDPSPPSGVQALWPFSTAWYQAPWPLFLGTSRHFDQPALFWRINTLALTRELLILLPVLAVVIWYTGRQQPGRLRNRRAVALLIAACCGATARLEAASAGTAPSGTTAAAVEGPAGPDGIASRCG